MQWSTGSGNAAAEGNREADQSPLLEKETFVSVFVGKITSAGQAANSFHQFSFIMRRNQKSVPFPVWPQLKCADGKWVSFGSTVLRLNEYRTQKKMTKTNEPEWFRASKFPWWLQGLHLLRAERVDSCCSEGGVLTGPFWGDCIIPHMFPW